MGWSGYEIRISLHVDAHGGDEEARGEQLRKDFLAELQKLCDDPRYVEISPLMM